SCGSGVSTCSDSGFSVADGTACGSNLACQGGLCAACTAGKTCSPTGSPCHAGQTSCATGREVCVDLGSALPNGTGCGTDQVCSGGSCVACAGGTACLPANPCHTGAIACGTGSPTCADTGFAIGDGAPCGSNLACQG